MSILGEARKLLKMVRWLLYNLNGQQLFKRDQVIAEFMERSEVINTDLILSSRENPPHTGWRNSVAVNRKSSFLLRDNSRTAVS